MLRLSDPMPPVVNLLSAEPLLALSTDDRPTVNMDGDEIQPGQVLVLEDTYLRLYWDGSDWQPVQFGQEIQLQTQLLREILAKE